MRHIKFREIWLPLTCVVNTVKNFAFGNNDNQQPLTFDTNRLLTFCSSGTNSYYLTHVLIAVIAH